MHELKLGEWKLQELTLRKWMLIELINEGIAERRCRVKVTYASESFNDAFE